MVVPGWDQTGSILKWIHGYTSCRFLSKKSRKTQPREKKLEETGAESIHILTTCARINKKTDQSSDLKKRPTTQVLGLDEECFFECRTIRLARKSL
jgi:hypothetical protein